MLKDNKLNISKALFFDLINDGHHFFYNYHSMKSIGNFKKYYFTGSNICEEQIKNLNNIECNLITTNNFKSNNNILSTLTLIIKLLEARRYIKSYNIDIACLLYLDNIILPLYILQCIVPIKCNLICVLHWKPNKKLKNYMLNRLSQKGMKLIVHTNDVKEKLESLGINNIEQIDYPMLEKKNISKEEAIKKLHINFDNSYKNILYFGGTRTDKGIDILLDALAECKEKFNLIIAGQEQNFSKGFIKEKLKEFSPQNVRLELKYIDDNDVEAYFEIGDIVVIPYRKVFAGESGILTEAINNKNIIVVPNIIHFPDIVNEYKNGLVYEAENIKDLAEKIDYVLKNTTEFKVGTQLAYEDNIKKKSTKVFSERYNNIIKSVL